MPIITSVVKSNGLVSKYPKTNAIGTITANVMIDFKAAGLLFIDRANRVAAACHTATITLSYRKRTGNQIVPVV